MLFKILRGPSSRISKDTTEFHDGYAYFTPDDGGFYIDAATESTDPDGAVQQKRIRVNPVMSVNGSTGDVILPTVFVVKLSGSGTTADPYVTDKTFDELNEAYDRGDICILRFDREAVEFALTYLYADLAYFNRLFLSGRKTMQEVSWDGNSGKIQITTIDIRESLDQSVTGQEIPTAEAVWNAIPHPEAKTDAQTQSVGADSDGKLWTAPSPVMSVNNKTGAVSLMASDVNAIPSNLTGTAGQVLTKTASGQKWADAPVDENSVLLKNISVSLPVSATWKRICYGNGKFVAIAYQSDIAAYSTDGINWTQVTLPVSTQWQSVCYGDNGFVAASDIGTEAVYSVDGISWEKVTLPTQVRGNAVCYGSNKFVMLHGGSSFNQNIGYSTDGITWTSVSLATSLPTTMSSICYGGGKFVAVPSPLTSTSDESIYSIDGMTWTQATLPAKRRWMSVCYGDGKFVTVSSAAGFSGSNTAAYSVDGITWIQTTLPAQKNWSSVCHGDGKFVAVSNANSNTAAYSVDGITWTQAILPRTAYWNSVFYGEGKFIAIAANKTDGLANVAYSTDGINWYSSYIALQYPDGTDIHGQVKDALQIEMPDTTITTDTSTKITGLLKGANGKVAQAVPDTDYVTPSALESLQEFYFSMNGTLAEQNLTIRDPGSLGDMAHALNEQILTHGDLIPIETCRPCIIAQGTGDAAESQIVLKYAGVGQDESLSIFSGIWHNAVNESQYSVSLLYKLGNPDFEQYNIVQLKNIDPSTTTPLAPTPLALTEDGSVGGGSVGTSTTYARGDHIHPSEVFICHIQKNSSTDLACDRTYAEIVAAYTAGKICIARLNNSCLYLNYYHRTKNLIHFLGTGRVSNSVIEIDINDNITLSTIRILPLAKQITLYKGAWDGSTKQQLVTVSGVLADPTLQEIRVMPVNAALDSPYIAAGIQCVAQATDNLTFACKTAPTEDIEVYVVIQDVNYRA